MDYTIEKVYTVAGKFDKVATITFKKDSEAFKLYGDHVTVVFLYNQFEREDLDQRIHDSNNVTQGQVRAKSLLSELSEEKKEKLANEGIHTGDIFSLFYFGNHDKNTFHSNETRTIQKINVPIYLQPKGKDIDWMYGLSKRYVQDGIGLCPRERAFYIAGKFYYEPEEMDDAEMDELIRPDGSLHEKVEWEFLQIKYRREELGEEGKKRLSAMFKEKKKNDLSLLDKYLKEAGSSIERLSKENIDMAAALLTKVNFFQERRLNVSGKIALYLDIDSYLHIYMRHVKELKVNSHFESKDNFQWSEDDVVVVMKKVIEQTNDEVQDYLQKNPGKRYGKWGRQSIYFEGDYYTIHIEPTGQISTFHKNRKQHEQDHSSS